MTAVLFWFFGALALLFAILCVTRRNPVYAAFFLLLTLGSLAVEFLLLHAPFIAAMQIILYAGAIVVLFVFVLMLLSLKDEELGGEAPASTKFAALVVALLTFAFLAAPAFRDPYLGRFQTEQGGLRAVPAEWRPKDLIGVVAARHGLTVKELTSMDPARLRRDPGPGGAPGAVAERDPREERRIQARIEAAWLCDKVAPKELGGLAALVMMSEAEAKRRAGVLSKDFEALEAGTLDEARRAAVREVRIRLAAMERRARVKAARHGSLEHFVEFLYTRYVVVFELVSVLIFAAIAAVVVLARRKGFMGMESDDADETAGNRRGGNLL